MRCLHQHYVSWSETNFHEGIVRVKTSQHPQRVERQLKIQAHRGEEERSGVCGPPHAHWPVHIPNTAGHGGVFRTGGKPVLQLAVQQAALQLVAAPAAPAR
jgi:hypothetical protein